MDNALATQLVTVGATLSGVVLTLLANAMLERRRAREAHRLETLRLSAEHTKWLRDERMRAYAAFSLAVEDVLQFLRAEELPPAARWPELRADLRKTYNQLLLLGAEEPREAGLRVWLLARNSVNDLFHDIPEGLIAMEAVAAAAREVGAELGRETNEFLRVCRVDLQSGLA